MRKYNVCLVGIGAVGTEIVKVLHKRHFPMERLQILARSERQEVIDGETFHVKVATPEAFQGMDFALFAGTEGAKGASKTLGWEAAQRGCVVIDNGDDFRMDPRVPLVIPEINAAALRDHQRFIANPNCSTAIALMPLAPLHRVARLRRIIACTYQAVSGTGSAAIQELKDQVKAWAEGREAKPSVYPQPIAFNVLAQIGSPKDDEPGYTTEEVKLKRETHKILGDPAIRVSATCVRVPVLNGHSEALHVEFEKPLHPEQAREILKHAPGVQVVDDLAQSLYPTPRACSGREEVLVGRIRRDSGLDNGLALFAAGDNLWKGAALNAIQIAEKMIEMRLV